MVLVRWCDLDRRLPGQATPAELAEADRLLDPVARRRLLARRAWLRALPHPAGCGSHRSSSGSLAIVAYTAGPCGIDVETAERWPLAATALRRADARAAAWLWVRLEAVLKASRRGLSDGIPASLVDQLDRGSPLVDWAGLTLRLTPIELPGALGAVAADPRSALTVHGPDAHA